MFFVFTCRPFTDALSAEHPSSTSAVAPTSLLARASSSQVALLRTKLAEAKLVALTSDSPRDKKNLARLQFKWQLASADATERHRLIRSLPVAIVEKNGIREFVSRGKVRSRVVPAAANLSSVVQTPLSFEQPDGASPAVATIIASDECEFEGQPDTCATALEQEDALILLADLDAEAEGYEDEADEAEDVYEEYCNTWGCDGEPETDIPTSGPSTRDDLPASAGCGGSWYSFGLSAAGWGLARYALYAAAAAATVSTGGLALVVISATVATASLAWSTGEVLNCVYSLPIFSAAEPWELNVSQVY